MCVHVSICSVFRGEGYTVITLYLFCLEAILSPLKLLQPDLGNWCIRKHESESYAKWLDCYCQCQSHCEGTMIKI